MVTAILSGYMYDIMGRRFTIGFCLILHSISVLLVPFTYPSIYPWMLLVRIVEGIAVVPLVSSPLVNDYVCNESRGTGFSL